MMSENGIDMSQILDYQLKISSYVAPVVGEEGESFGFLPLRQLAVDGKIPFNIYLRAKTKDNNSEPSFVVCCQRSQVFLKNWKIKLEQLKIPGVYYSKPTG